jgi:hypothetical protein
MSVVNIDLGALSTALTLASGLKSDIDTYQGAVGNLGSDIASAIGSSTNAITFEDAVGGALQALNTLDTHLSNIVVALTSIQTNAGNVDTTLTTAI